MKVGLSYSRCILDIVANKVLRSDVLIIISRTMMDPNNDESWKSIWQGYKWSIWDRTTDDDEPLFRKATIDLMQSGKLHQPRKFGAYLTVPDYHWLETVLPSSELDSNPTLKKSWDQFQVVAGLSNVTLDKNYG